MKNSEFCALINGNVNAFLSGNSIPSVIARNVGDFEVEVSMSHQYNHIFFFDKEDRKKRM